MTAFPGGVLEDDSYFYAQIAYNIGTTGVSTFDLMNVTSGYHFLWCWVLSGVTWMLKYVTTDKMVHLFMYIYIYVLFLLFIVKNNFSSTWQRVFALILLSVPPFLMESAMMSFMLIVLVMNRNNNRIIAHSIAFLLPFVRIDAFIIIILLYYFNRKDSKEWKYVLLSAGIGAVLQIVVMRVFYGEYMSISGFLKTENLSIVDNLWNNILHNIKFILLLTGLLLTSYLGKKRPGELHVQRLMVASVLYLIIMLFLNQGVRGWYFFLPIVTIIMNLFYQMDESAKLKYSIITVICLFVIYERIENFYTYASDIQYNREFVEKIREYVPYGEAVFQIDGSGFIGYHSLRKIVNGDGLVNSYDYARMKSSKMLNTYLERNNINYLITNTPLVNENVVNYAGLIVNLADVKINVERKKPINHYYSHFTLWKINQ